jgi:hypothetical protein
MATKVNPNVRWLFAIALAIAAAGCLVENGRATNKCRAVGSKDDCKQCCVRNGAKGHMWSYSTGQGGTCTCRGGF